MKKGKYLVLIFCLAMLSCTKKLPENCYDKGFEDAHKNDICLQDCPGITGCDGKNYCNECIMHSHGIKAGK